MDLSQYSVRDFDRGASRFREALWAVARICFFQNPIPWPSVLRCMLLRAFGAAVGNGVVIRAEVNISFPWRLIVGDWVWIGEGVNILSLAEVRIGSNVCVSQRAFFCTGSHDHRSRTFDLITRPIVIGEGAWIAAQAFVGPGVEIGAGSVVAAGAVVVSDVPSGSMARGNPAQVALIQRDG